MDQLEELQDQSADEQALNVLALIEMMKFMAHRTISFEALAPCFEFIVLRRYNFNPSGKAM
jgi:hypothetical protein